ncbi:MAG TPA: hypothetical protein VFP84_14795 [Kofleriaceae bacterium]|nr:hypothetical protein [Kofleriaceae bacterium]
MPAPQASAFQQLARAKFTTFNLVVPTNWKDPQGAAGDHYSRAFKPEERSTAPGAPPLFQAASSNKYHTDTQKMHIGKIGGFIDGVSSAICSAWGKWQMGASIAGVVVAGPTATGGQLLGPPLTPLILAEAPKSTPQEAKYSNVIAQVIGTGWLTFTATVKVPGLPLYPLFATMASPVAPPTPNTPVPFAALTQLPISISCQTMKMQMIAQLADPTAPFHKELFESICDAFEKSYNAWKVSTQVTKMLGTGPVPTFAPPLVPAGPVVGGVANMPPGGLT